MSTTPTLARPFAADCLLPTQKGRPMSIETPLGQDALLLKQLHVSEAISSLYEIQCELLSVADLGDLKELLQRSVRIRLQTAPDSVRFFHGHVRAVRQLDCWNTFYRYSITVCPKVWFLDLVYDCRIFQNKTVPEIVREVLKENGIEHREKLHSEYPRRTYCVQYRESILHFVSRLCEEEGIYYHFEHRDGGHTMMFHDVSGAAKPVPGEEVVFFNDDQVEHPQERVVCRIQRGWTATNDSYIHNDFNFEWPQVRMEAADAGPDSKLSTYDYPGLYDLPKKGRRLARLRLEQLECASSIVEADTTVAGLMPGWRTTLKGHHVKSLNQAYFLTSVIHEAIDNSYRSAGAEPEGEPFCYRNRVRAIPSALPYRHRTEHPRPVVKGTQTAIVVGPEGEEIHTDEYGRVKVQFHWDRRGKRDQRSSCWIRVSQSWGGGRWGGVTIPRIGQEVVVDFLEGDPDRPIITGRVYNSDQMPPYDLPANAHRSGTKTRSLGGGGGFNEFSMSDAGGREQIFLHAQKDLDSVIGNNETRVVGNNRTTKVGVDQSLAVGNNLTETVGNSMQTHVASAYTITCDTFLLNAKTSIKLVTGASTIHMNQAGIITISGNLITVTASVLSTITAPITAVTGAMVLSLNGLLCNVASKVTNIFADSLARVKSGSIKLNC